MKQAILIRCEKISRDETNLKICLSDFFGSNIYFVIDHFHDSQIKVEITGNNIVIGRQFLLDNRLPFFSRAAWQCGDYFYYAAHQILADKFDYLWMIEPDVHFTFPPRNFFEMFTGQQEDLLAPHLGPRNASWFWHESMTEFSPAVWGMLFPLTRLSSDALAFLFLMRKHYAHKKEFKDNSTITWSIKDYANDEAFVATTLKRNNYACSSLNEFMPFAFEDTFTPDIPILDCELGADKYIGKIIHPACSKEKSVSKFQHLGSPENSPKTQKRMKDIIESYGPTIWEVYSGFTANQD